MKKILLTLACSVAIYLAGCQDELYKDASSEFKSGQGVFMNTSFAQVFAEEGKEVEVNDLSISLASKTDKIVEVNLSIGDKTLLDDYNKKNGTTYILLPADMYELSNKVIFEPRFTSVALPIKLKDIKYSTDGTYALPIKVAGGNADVIGGQDHALLVLEQRLRTKSLRFNAIGFSVVTFPDDFSVNQWTFEFTINRTYNVNNVAVVGSIRPDGADMLSEIYTRFGDVTINANQFQFKTANSQIDVSSDVWVGTPNTWHTISLVYDGKRNMIYADGRLVASREMREGAYRIKGFWIDGRNKYFREMRFWNVARTEKQIVDNRWKMVNPDEDGLLVYYPMNGKRFDRENGLIVEDESKIWDWTKGEKHVDMPSRAIFDNNNGDGFLFPPAVR